MQNDDWVYYKTIESFLRGIPYIDPYISATFYGQAYLGTAFAKIFGIPKLPILTLIVSVVTIYVFAETIRKFFVKKSLSAILISLFLLFNPFFAYSVWGFMTENYFLVFFIASLYFIERFNNKENEFLSFVFSILCILLSYSVRQFGLITLATFVLWLCLKGKFWYMLIGTIIFSLVITIHFNLLPERWGYFENELAISNIRNTRIIFTKCLAFAVYLTAFLFPLVGLSFVKFINIRKWYFWFCVLLSAVSFVYCLKVFYPKVLYNTNFYFFENTVTRHGFFSSLYGYNRYRFILSDSFYALWETISKIFIIPITAIGIFTAVRSIKYPNFYLMHIASFVFLLLISPYMYDRYILPLFPLTILFLFSTLHGRLASTVSLVGIGLFLIFLFLYTYNYSLDFVLKNNYIWSRSLELTRKGTILSNIYATRGWKKYFGESRNDPEFLYGYTNNDRFERINAKEDYILHEQHRLEFPLNLYKDPVVNLYKRKKL
jgi:hypothetical protein